MEMNSLVGTNVLDAEAQGAVGKPLDRVDGRLKVTGGARYAYEVEQGPANAYGYVVEASIGKGRIKSIDTRPRSNRRASSWSSPIATRPSKAPAITTRPIPCSPVRRCRITAQPVAFVVAETFEQARAAAYLVNVKYDQAPGKYALRNSLPTGAGPAEDGAPPDSAVGDFAARSPRPRCSWT